MEHSVSVLTANQNRYGALKVALGSWLAVDGIAEVIIVDWSSDVPIATQLASDGLNSDARIRVLRVEGEERWSLAAALNYGLPYIQCPVILKLDAEVSLRSDFLTKNFLSSGEFFAGNWKTAFPWGRSINGSCMVSAADVLSVGGWDPRIEGYGWEDTDFYSRLQYSGLFRRDLYPGTIKHARQSRASRMETKGWIEPLAPEDSTLVNRFVALGSTPWSPVVADRMADRENYRDRLVRKNLLLEAVARVATGRSIVSRLLRGRLGIHRPLRFRLRSWLSDRGLLSDVGVIYIEANFGLGNRLRAVFSALLVAAAMRRKLIVIWLPDDHCNIPLSSLFDYRGPVIETLAELTPLLQSKNLKVVNYMETGYKPRKGMEIRRFPPRKNVYIRSMSALKHPAASPFAMSWVARLWTPTREISDKIRALIPCDVGIHCRSEIPNSYSASYDQAVSNWPKKSHIEIIKNRRLTQPEAFVEHLLESLPERRHVPKLSLHVASDSQEAKDLIANSVEDSFAMVRNRRVATDRSPEAVRDALVDAYALAESHYFVGSRYSSFTNLVTLLREPGARSHII